MRRILGVAVLMAFLGMVSVVRAEPAVDTAPPTKALEAAKALTKITGVAISPLLGTAAVGAYDYFTASKEKKAHLPWFAHPQFWIPALLLVGIVAAKDCFGAVMPPGVKKPLDVAEVFENKVSGLVATGAFVPIVAAIFGTFTSNNGHATDAGHQVYLAGLATFNISAVFNVLTIPLAMSMFVVVWMLGHVINILILVSPIGAVDAALKSVRTSLMGLVTVTSFVNPWAGAFLSLIIIVVAYFLSGWSFRLSMFGSVYAWDFITGRHRRFRPEPDANWAFTACAIEKTPIRTYGKLMRGENGKLSLEYRPLLFVGQKKTVAIPEGRYFVGRGFFNPEIVRLDPQREREKVLLTLPPRYRTHEEEMAKAYSIAEVRDVGLLRGFKAARDWLRSLFGLSTPTEASA